MRRQWILIGQSILKTIRTIGEQEQNANVREIVAGYGGEGDQWVKQIEIVVQDSSKSTGISGKMEKGLRVFRSHSHNFFFGGLKSLRSLKRDITW